MTGFLGTLQRMFSGKGGSGTSPGRPEIKETVLIKNMLALHHLSVKDLMIPRADIPWIDSRASLADILTLVKKSTLPTFPLCQGKLDQVVGVLPLKTLLLGSQNFGKTPLTKKASKALFVSPSLPCTSVLMHMTQDGHDIAFVVDEYGAVDGLISLKELVFEMMEALQENTAAPAMIEYTENGDLIGEGLIPLEDVEEMLGISCDYEGKSPDATTLGGLVMDLAEHVPKKGAVIHHPNGIEFHVIAADPRKVGRVRLVLPPQTPQKDSL